MTARYAAMFHRLRQRGEGAFGAFVMLGDPDLETSARILDLLVDADADMIEVGIPFSDPVADGPTIQAAAERALSQGVTPSQCFTVLAAFRRRHPEVPVGILTYANIVSAPGRDAFYRAAAEAGVDSVLVADVPEMEAAPFVASAIGSGIAPVLIAAPNTPRRALARIARMGRGYTYCVARSGVTGAERAMELDHGALLGALAELGAPPAVLGFGISTPDHVRDALGAGAAGVISGSAIVKLVESGDLPAVSAFVGEMKAATRA
ncbi:tryptophan synthase subunit alpha [Sphingosinicella sp. YJ22]|uniref:tryptophan synthase subunit alpha n=1 Tax=Sphingosinicella sp. YJ22 TaxID=1104780 RepID=UPI001407BCCA|nr:tryptophan synthase subunit alpha [Sphingosinicella sp. YJ22]